MGPIPQASPATRLRAAPTIAPLEDFMLKLYGMTGSGNCYKPALLMRPSPLPSAVAISA